MLNKGTRDQESIRIDNVLKTLLSIVFVPKFWDLEDKTNIEEQLKDFGLNIQSLIDFDKNDLITLLIRCHLDWNQLEQFADFLVSFSKENTFDLLPNAIAIYSYIQAESKVFSFGINSKIATAKANL
ncbi:hypothetical protein [Flavobacterium sp. WC2429]|uniref:Uncharacterized protein n=2 Tax=unclassified Flavobacterium TaxID=196869 RepID=A0AB39WE45_9FLAO